MPVKLGFIILSIIGVLRIPEEFYLYKDKENIFVTPLPINYDFSFSMLLGGNNYEEKGLKKSLTT